MKKRLCHNLGHWHTMIKGADKGGPLTPLGSLSGCYSDSLGHMFLSFKGYLWGLGTF